MPTDVRVQRGRRPESLYCASNLLQLGRQELEGPMSLHGMTRATIYPNHRTTGRS